MRLGFVLSVLGVPLDEAPGAYIPLRLQLFVFDPDDADGFPIALDFARHVVELVPAAVRTTPAVPWPIIDARGVHERDAEPRANLVRHAQPDGHAQPVHRRAAGGAGMRRDMELIRKMALAIEASPTGYADELEIEGDYTHEHVGDHAYLMIQGRRTGCAIFALHSHSNHTTASPPRSSTPARRSPQQRCSVSRRSRAVTR